MPRTDTLTEPHGEGGFGYDPVFMPDGYSDSMAVLGSEVKTRYHTERMRSKNSERSLGE